MRRYRFEYIIIIVVVSLLLSSSSSSPSSPRWIGVTRDGKFGRFSSRIRVVVVWALVARALADRRPPTSTTTPRRNQWPVNCDKFEERFCIRFYARPCTCVPLLGLRIPEYHSRGPSIYFHSVVWTTCIHLPIIRSGVCFFVCHFEFPSCYFVRDHSDWVDNVVDTIPIRFENDVPLNNNRLLSSNLRASCGPHRENGSLHLFFFFYIRSLCLKDN